MPILENSVFFIPVTIVNFVYECFIFYFAVTVDSFRHCLARSRYLPHTGLLFFFFFFLHDTIVRFLDQQVIGFCFVFFRVPWTL